MVTGRLCPAAGSLAEAPGRPLSFYKVTTQCPLSNKLLNRRFWNGRLIPWAPPWPRAPPPPPQHLFVVGPSVTGGFQQHPWGPATHAAPCPPPQFCQRSASVSHCLQGWWA